MALLLAVLMGGLFGYGYYRRAENKRVKCEIKINRSGNFPRVMMMGLFLASSFGTLSADSATPAGVIQLSPDTWKKVVLKSKKPVLVDFWAPWCGPCRMQGPIVEQVAEQIGDKAVVAKLNTDEGREIAAHYKIMYIPTLMVFKNGIVQARYTSVTRGSTLLAALKKASKNP